MRMKIHLVLLFSCTIYFWGIVIVLRIFYLVSKDRMDLDHSSNTIRNRTSSWSWLNTSDIPKGSAPDLATPIGIVRFAIIMIWFVVSREAIHFWLGKSYGNLIFSAYNSFGIVVLFSEFIIAELAAECLSLLSKKPMSIAYSILLHRGKRKSKVAKKYLITALIAWTIFYPIRVLGLLNFGAADQRKLVYSPPFSLTLNVYDYSTSTIISKNGNTEVYNTSGDVVSLDELFERPTDNVPITKNIVGLIEKKAPI